jgi:hypothetical protein
MISLVAGGEMTRDLDGPRLRSVLRTAMLDVGDEAGSDGADLTESSKTAPLTASQTSAPADAASRAAG